MTTPEQRALTAELVTQMSMRLDRYIALPPPIWTPAREVGESLHFLFLPVAEDYPNTPKGLSPVECIALITSSPNMTQRAQTIMPRTAMVKDFPLLLDPTLHLILESAVTDFSDRKIPSAPKEQTRPNSLAFGDIVPYRLVNTAMMELRTGFVRVAMHIGPQEFRTRTFDLAIVSAPDHEPGGPGKSLVYCASKQCEVFGKLPYRCSRCKVRTSSGWTGILQS